MVTSKRKRLIFTAMAVALVGIVTGLLPGCASTPSPATQAANEVILTGRAYIPDPITVTIGTTVTWTNEDPEAHSVTSDDLLFDADLAPGESFSYTFNEPGTFSYRCAVHYYEPGGYKVIVE
jgi:plastocyanin